MLSSPSQWWAATIVPYLPGGVVEIRGGIGLSGILLRAGISPPPLFFVALMGLVGIGSLFLYATRYSKSRYYVWIFPVMILFFYYRSFPNYIFYWSLPLVLEFFRNRPALSIWHFSPFKGIALRPTIAVGLHSLRVRLRVPLLASLLLTTIFVGAYGVYVSSSPPSRLDVRINSVSDPDGIGAATLLNLTLDNQTPKPITPSFFVYWLYLPFLWSSNSTRTLGPMSSASYIVTATDGVGAIPRSTSFRVYVFDATTGNLVGESLSLTPNIPLPAIANPHFCWSTSHGGAGTKAPFGCQLTPTNIDQLTS